MKRVYNSFKRSDCTPIKNTLKAQGFSPEVECVGGRWHIIVPAHEEKRAMNLIHGDGEPQNRMKAPEAIAMVREILCACNREDLVATPVHWRIAGALTEQIDTERERCAKIAERVLGDLGGCENIVAREIRNQP